MEYSITLTEAELNQVVNALADKPYRETASLISKISGQVQAQTANTPQPVEN